MHKALFEPHLSCELAKEKTISKEQADYLFRLFKDCTLFRWNDKNNNCEDRANAISILLDKWGVPNYKGWVFSGAFLKKEKGILVNNWKYHVAASVQVKEDRDAGYYIIDPSTSNKLETIQQWSNNITDIAHNYYFITEGNVYIFHPGKIERDNWFRRNNQNYKWTIQGLAGINGVSSLGKAQLIFCKGRIAAAEKYFKDILQKKPSFLE